MPTVSITQALKAKSRLIKKIRENAEQITKWNSVLDGVERAIDVQEVYKQNQALVQVLGELKAAIQIANAPIQQKIFALAEQRSAHTWLSRLNTTSGPANINFTGELANYNAALSGAFVIQEQTRIAKAIDKLQDELDAFNATTQIEIPEIPTQ